MHTKLSGRGNCKGVCHECAHCIHLRCVASYVHDPAAAGEALNVGAWEAESNVRGSRRCTGLVKMGNAAFFARSS